jgi:hypothetical protein
MPIKININILLHGLFFMEANNDKLEIYAPPTVSGHRFEGGSRGNVVDLSSITAAIDLSDASVLQGKPKADVSDVRKTRTILQFSRTPVGAFQTKQTNRLIILPWPLQFFSIRLGDISGFTFDTSGSAVIGNDIKARCGDAKNRIGIVTGLTYTADFSGPVLPGEHPTRNIHFYYDPGIGHDVNAVNDDLRHSRDIFTNGPGFDLQMQTNANYPATPLDDPANFPNVPGISPEDGLALDEPVKTELDQSTKAFFEKVISFRLPGEDFMEQRKKLSDGVDRMINPANCPNFFVLPQGRNLIQAT